MSPFFIYSRQYLTARYFKSKSSEKIIISVAFVKRTNSTINFIKVKIHSAHPNIDLNIPIQVN